jgi:hypothetical protein
MDLLSIKITADDIGARTATASLDKMTVASRQADAAIQSLGKSGATGLMQFTRATDAAAAAQQRLAAASGASIHRTAGLATQLADVGQMLALGQAPMMTLLQQGPQIFSMYGNSLAGLRTALSDVGKMATGVVTKFWPLIGLSAALGVGIGAMTREINQAGNASVNFGDVAKAAFQVPANAIYEFLQPAITSVSDWWGTELDIFADQTKMIVNFLTQNFLVGFETIKSGIMILPDAFIVAGQGAANGFLKGIEWLVQQAAEKLNGLMGPLNALLQFSGKDPIQLINPASLTIPPLNIGGDAAQARIGAEAAALTGRTVDIRGTDFGGEWFGAIMDQSASNATQRLAEDLTGVGGAAAAANDNARTLGVTLSEAARAAQAEWDFYRGTFNSFFSDLKSGLKEGQSFWQAFGGAASNALDSIANRAMEMATNGLFDMLFGSLMGGFTSAVTGGSMAGGFVPGLTGPSLMGIPGMATGGTVARPGLSWVGERGPELMRLPRGAQIIPHQQSMAMAANGNGSNDNRPVQLNVHVSGANGNAEIRQMALEGAQEALDHYRRFSFHQDWEQHNTDPTARG